MKRVILSTFSFLLLIMAQTSFGQVSTKTFTSSQLEAIGNKCGYEMAADVFFQIYKTLPKKSSPNTFDLALPGPNSLNVGQYVGVNEPSELSIYIYDKVIVVASQDGIEQSLVTDNSAPMILYSAEQTPVYDKFGAVSYTTALKNFSIDNKDAPYPKAALLHNVDTGHETNFTVNLQKYYDCLAKNIL